MIARYEVVKVVETKELAPTVPCNEVDPYGLALSHAGLDGVHYPPGQLFRVSISYACNASWTNLTARRCRGMGYKEEVK
jgi:hypothetical protein